MIKFNLCVRHRKRSTIATNKTDWSRQHTAVKVVWMWALSQAVLLCWPRLALLLAMWDDTGTWRDEGRWGRWTMGYLTGWSRVVWGFIRLLRTTCNLKLHRLFTCGISHLIFSYHSRLWVANCRMRGREREGGYRQPDSATCVWLWQVRSLPELPCCRGDGSHAGMDERRDVLRWKSTGGVREGL